MEQVSRIALAVLAGGIAAVNAAVGDDLRGRNDVARGLGAEEDAAVGVGGVVAVIHQLDVGADLAVVAGDELEDAQDAALVHRAEDKERVRSPRAGSSRCPCRSRRGPSRSPSPSA